MAADYIEPFTQNLSTLKKSKATPTCSYDILTLLSPVSLHGSIFQMASKSSVVAPCLYANTGRVWFILKVNSLMLVRRLWKKPRSSSSLADSWLLRTSDTVWMRSQPSSS